jgi:hypothetical protein
METEGVRCLLIGEAGLELVSVIPSLEGSGVSASIEGILKVQVVKV